MPAPSIRRIVYGSSSPVLLGADAVADILRVSRANNAADGVTGALLYAEGNFLQVLEGVPEVVARTYERICRDPRHRRVLTFLDQQTDRRLFAEWSMALVRPDALSADDRASVRSLYDVDASDLGPVRHLLRSFREMATGALPGAVRA